jgi:hypothetical protein
MLLLMMLPLVMLPLMCVPLSITPTMLGIISIPTMTVPVVSTTPIPPVAVKISIVYPMISRRHTENIIRWNSHDRPWHKRYLDRSPRSTVKGSPEPMISMKPIPVASVEI